MGDLGVHPRSCLCFVDPLLCIIASVHQGSITRHLSFFFVHQGGLVALLLFLSQVTTPLALRIIKVKVGLDD